VTKRSLAVLGMTLLCVISLSAQSHIRTRWAADVKVEAPLLEYPRPQMVRAAWTNLNGLWNYAITSRDVMSTNHWDGKILVPFPIQSQLSGVERPVADSERLWYGRSFRAPTLTRGERLLLHFGAVDWEARVWVNGMMVGEHRGGYDPFTIDITDALTPSGEQELKLSVSDPTDRGPQPRGKQVLAPKSIWYSAVTGIWQTVWLEPVPAAHIRDIVAVPDIDAGTVRLHVTVDGADAGTRVNAQVQKADVIFGAAAAGVGTDLVIAIPNVHQWSTTEP